MKSSRQWLYVALLILLGMCLPKSVKAQAVRFDTVTDTTSSTCVSGKQCPILALPGTIVSVCGGSVTTLASCLASPATTYTDYTAGTPCPSTGQLTPATGGACLSTSDAQGGAGFWALPGQYNYFLRVPTTAGGGTYGPYPINVGAASGCNPDATCDANFSTLPLACTAAGSGTLYLTRNWNGLTTQTLACNIQALANGIIKPASGQVVTLAGSFSGSLTQHFDYSSGGLFAASTAAKVSVIYPQWLGAKGNGETIVDGSISSSSAVLSSATAGFTSADVGKYISVQGCGTSGSGLGTTIASYQSSTQVTLSATCGTGGTGLTVTFGTNDYTALYNTAVLAAALHPQSVVYPPQMYVIGQHKTASDSCTNINDGDILWNGIGGIDITGYGATIYIDSSFYQNADCATSTKSANNAITPFFMTAGSSNYKIRGFQFSANAQTLTRKASGVTSESLTSFCVANGGSSVQSNYVLQDLGCVSPQTDCYEYAYNSVVTDLNASGTNLTCSAPARGNLSVGNINGLHLSGVHFGTACTGSYAAFQPCHGIDVEPNLTTTDNIVIDGASTFTNDVGFEFEASDPTKTNHVVIKDSIFSWSNSSKQEGFECFSKNCLVDGNTFNVGYSASTRNIYIPTGAGGFIPIVSHIWQNNIINDTTAGSQSGAIWDATGGTDGSLSHVDAINNTFNLNGLVVQARNSRQFIHNHVYWTTTGLESAGTTTAVNVEGSQSVHDNDYNTNLAASGKAVATLYNGTSTIPIIQNEHYLNTTYYIPTCSQCSGSSLVSNTTSTNVVSDGNFATNPGPWVVETNWAISGGLAVATAATSSQHISQSVSVQNSGDFYQVTYIVSSYSAGNVHCFLGATACTTRSANGTYTEVIQAAAAGTISFGFVGSGGTAFTGDVGSVSVLHLPSPSQ